MVTDAAIRTALVEKLHASNPTAKVHRRWRWPANNRLAEFANLFREGGAGTRINGYMIRRIHRTPVMKGIPGRLVSVTFTYAIRFYAHLIDSDDDGVASEEALQLMIDANAAGFEADVQMGLGKTVSHTGLQMPQDIIDVVLGDAGAHRVDYRLEVTVANVNC